MPDPIRTPFEPPEFGGVVEIDRGVFWVRMPLPEPLGHVNCYLFDEGDAWTLVDTGVDTQRTRDLWSELFAGPLGAKPVARLIVTHHHLDHVGLAGWFTEQGAELVMTRTAYLTARMLQLDAQDRPTPEMERFWRACGIAPDVLEARMRVRPFNTSDAVGPIPLGFTRIVDGGTIAFGGRDWTVRTGDGHAPEHATFWEQGGPLVVGGDQLLAAISPNLGVHATEPAADPVGEWMESCVKFQKHATDAHLVLVGHRLPFTGLPARLGQLIDNHTSALERLIATLSSPMAACDCFEVLFGRTIKQGEYGLAMVEAMAHCVHLHHAGLVTRTIRDDGAYLWQAKGQA